MKKVLHMILSLTIVIVFFVGCTANAIVGKWSDDNDTIEFKRNGKVTSRYYFMNATYEVKGNKVTISDIGLTETYEFSISDGVLSMEDIDNGGTIVLEKK